MGGSSSAERRRLSSIANSENDVVVQEGKKDEVKEVVEEIRDPAGQKPIAVVVTPADKPIVITAQLVWESFFNVCFRITENVLSLGLITRDNVEDRDAFIYFGLVGATVMETCERSLDIEDGFALAIGLKITEANCPVEHVKFFKGMMALKQQRKQAQLSKDEIVALRKIVVYASSEDKPDIVIKPQERSTVVMRVAAMIQSISTDITQFGDFRKYFDTNLDLVLKTHAAQPSNPEKKPQPPAEGKQDGGLDTIWLSFFSNVYNIAEHVVASGFVSAKVVSACEETVMSGLAAVCVLDAIRRSLPTEGIKLAVNGGIITQQTCPPAHLKLYTALMKLKELVVAAKPSDSEFSTLQQMALNIAKDSDFKSLSFASIARKNVLVEATQLIHAIIKPVTQEAFFGKQMKDVIQLWSGSSDLAKSGHVRICPKCTFHEAADATKCSVCGSIFT